MNDWTELKKSFTQRQEDALWQYFLDHSKIQKNGYIGVLFYIKNIDDFWRRLYARFTGEFKRYDKLERENQMANCALNVMKKMGNNLNKTMTIIKEKGTMFDKIILKCYKMSRDYLKNYKI
jgi:hypothetical protein